MYLKNTHIRNFEYISHRYSAVNIKTYMYIIKDYLNIYIYNLFSF